MVDVVVQVEANADDGHINGTTFQANENLVTIGDEFGTNFDTWFRFDNVTIPKDASISSAVLRFQAGDSDSADTVRTNIYIEDADDPSAPTSTADYNGRSRSSAVTWDFTTNWTSGNDYDTVDFSGILETHLSRAGWASGQAINVFIEDDGSTTNANREVKSHNFQPANAAYLRVTYEVSGQMDVAESIEVSESVTVEIEELLEPTLDESIEVSESITVEMGGIPGQMDVAESINVSEWISVGVEDVLGTINPDDSIEVSESVSVDLLLSPSIAESVELTEDVNVNLDIQTSWIALANAGLAIERYFFTLTGAADSTTDIEIAISSFQARKRTDESTYLSVVVPDYTGQADAISARSNGEMVIEMRYEYGGETSIRQEIVRADLEDIQLHRGGRNRSIILTGHKTQTFINRSLTLENSVYRAVSSGRITHRFAKCDPYLNPGDTVTVDDDDTFVVDYVSFIVAANYKLMEIRET